MELSFIATQQDCSKYSSRLHNGTMYYSSTREDVLKIAAGCTISTSAEYGTNIAIQQKRTILNIVTCDFSPLLHTATVLII